MQSCKQLHVTHSPSERLATDLSWLTPDDPRTARRAAAVVILAVVNDNAADKASVIVGV